MTAGQIKSEMGDLEEICIKDGADLCVVVEERAVTPRGSGSQPAACETPQGKVLQLRWLSIWC